MYKKFNIKQNTINFIEDIEKELSSDFDLINKIYEYNQLKVLNSYIKNDLSETHFIESTGYGYNDLGRDKIEVIYSDVFNTEDALVREQIVSGTHAISLVLFALTRPGDNILSVNGLPYNTIRPTLGLNNEISSLKEYNIGFDYVDLIDGKDFDYDAIRKKLDNINVVMIQRSRGYGDRSSLSIDDISKCIKFIKKYNNNIKIMVDNCYGEFVNKQEPSDVGADIICGSLIKNPGGGIVKSGGYICGKKDLIERCAHKLTTPGLGKEVGINFNQNRNILQGLYFSPQIVANSMKTVKLFSKVFEYFKFNTLPKSNEMLNDIVISIQLNTKDNLYKFCDAIQKTSPVDAFVNLNFSSMPGYDKKVIMAAGNFISGSSIELSCDGIEYEPYFAYLQGGLSYFQAKLAVMKAIENLNLM